MCKHRRLHLLPPIALLIILLPLSLAAQVDRGSISGTVTDPSGSVVQGAQVELLSVATSLQRETVTNAAGIYDFPALALVVYNISITTEG